MSTKDFDVENVADDYCRSKIVISDGLTEDSEQLFSGCGRNKPDIIRNSLS